MTKYIDEEQRTLAYFHDSVNRGGGYFRAKNIAEAIGLIARQVGSRPPRLVEKSEGIEVEKRGRARLTTRHITRS